MKYDLTSGILIYLDCKRLLQMDKYIWGLHLGKYCPRLLVTMKHLQVIFTKSFTNKQVNGTDVSKELNRFGFNWEVLIEACSVKKKETCLERGESHNFTQTRHFRNFISFFNFVELNLPWLNFLNHNFAGICIKTRIMETYITKHLMHIISPFS